MKQILGFYVSYFDYGGTRASILMADFNLGSIEHESGKVFTKLWGRNEGR